MASFVVPQKRLACTISLSRPISTLDSMRERPCCLNTRAESYESRSSPRSPLEKAARARTDLRRQAAYVDGDGSPPCSPLSPSLVPHCSSPLSISPYELQNGKSALDSARRWLARTFSLLLLGHSPPPLLLASLTTMRAAELVQDVMHLNFLLSRHGQVHLFVRASAVRSTARA